MAEKNTLTLIKTTLVLSMAILVGIVIWRTGVFQPPAAIEIEPDYHQPDVEVTKDIIEEPVKTQDNQNKITFGR